METARPSDFSPIAREAFGFLTDDLGFSLVEDEWHQSSASWIVRYERPDRVVKLVWGLKDTQFYFQVRRPADEGAGRDRFYVFQLMHHVDPGPQWSRDLDIGSSPTLARLRERVQANADALRSHGWSILAGNEWFSPTPDRRAV